ncbi:hypothetical protein K388_05607 [Streptomyces sp. KhCrAH-43]|uniref:hypothetical protein n=1 Tax=unclassified Streptomyces TaxID=2593676 RepID=UPI00036C781E|nr:MULTISPECIES: hypothetical protein [unclassified Streptomyces]MYX67338.1 hypothetical protein [Streptomyces sp. SID8373]RAJ53820.1 hypothetical protein K388_05607 [Streptomyces sp. KhCrAH-43]
MAYNSETLHAAANRSGIPFDYLARLQAAEAFDLDDPDGNNVLEKQMTVIFDHHLAKLLSSSDPVAALRSAGFTEAADALVAHDA